MYIYAQHASFEQFDCTFYVYIDQALFVACFFYSRYLFSVSSCSLEKNIFSGFSSSFARVITQCAKKKIIIPLISLSVYFVFQIIKTYVEVESVCLSTVLSQIRVHMFHEGVSLHLGIYSRNVCR